mmetsp:Transcript_16258/g.42615  ORF Transcript_16258/g.42615 Transcript_16258/m.42615 type:complete len:123 (-) Transcript_16258:330-698(-)
MALQWPALMLALTVRERTTMLKGRSYMYKPPGVLYLNLRFAPSVNHRWSDTERHSCPAAAAPAPRRRAGGGSKLFHRARATVQRAPSDLLAPWRLRRATLVTATKMASTNTAAQVFGPRKAL